MNPAHRQKFALLIKKARKSFLAYLMLFNNPKTSQIKMGKLHKFLADLVQGVVDGTYGAYQAVSIPPQHGKALHDDTLIPTPDGFKKIADLEVGDRVFTQDGSVTSVLCVKHWKRRPIYKLTMDDGTFVKADGEHLWSVRMCRKRKTTHTLWTTERLSKRTSSRSPALPESGALVLPEKPFVVAPYVLGCWLGDGNSNGNLFTATEEDQEHYAQRFSAMGFPVSRTAYAMRFRLQASWYIRWLKDSGLHENKHIPERYMRGSAEQRRELLKGLIDTDGYVSSDGQVEFCNVNYRLACDVRRLVHSLGIKAAMSEGRATINGVDCGPKYRILFYADRVASLPRKVARLRNPQKRCRYIEKVERCGTGNTTCIQVNHPSGMFLCGEACIPTHNSLMLAVETVSWLMGHSPGISIAIAGHRHDLMTEFSQQVKARISNPLYALVFPKAGEIIRGRDKADSWMLGNRSTLRAKSVGSKLTGNRVDWLIIDDAHAGRAEAESETQRNRVHQWYFGDCVTRLSPGAKVFIIGTRWHPKDLIGHLTSKEYVDTLKAEGQEERIFEVTNLPAFAGENDPLGRESGEALFPEVRNAAWLMGVKASIPSYEWDSQYMGNPRSIAEGQADISRLRRIPMDRVPIHIPRLRGWDLALTEKKTSDYSVGSLCAWDADKEEFYILNMFRVKLAWPKLEPRLLALSLRDKLEWNCNKMAMEAVSGFEIGLQNIRKALSGQVKVVKRNPGVGGKLMRAQGWLNVLEKGRMFMVEGPWNKDFLDELLDFPNGKNDDIEDSVSVAWEELTSPQKLLYG